MTSTAAEEFDTLSFEKQLTSLKDTQDSIQGLSSWCLQKRQHHKKIVASWLSILKRAKVEQRLTLFHLANDVIQYSKKKNYEFVESWGTTLQKATPLVRDDKIKTKILRIFRIWKERQIYDEEFLTDLTGLLSLTAGKPADVDPNDFQPKQLVNKIRQCSVLETETEVQLKQINECTLPLKNVKVLCQLLKDRRDTDGAKKDLDDGILKLEGCVCALQKELVARAALCRMLEKARIHYNTTKGEVKVVANAYKNFGNHVRSLKRKLDELCKELPSEIKSPVPSPPSPGEPVPSPGPDEDLELPSGTQDNLDGSNLNNSFGSDMGKDFAAKSFSSFVGNSSFTSLRSASDLLSGKSEEAKKIEVINSRADSISDVSVSIHSLLKSLIPNKPPPTISSTESYLPLLTPPPPPPPPLLPGLDLLEPNPDKGDAPRTVLPPMNFYGSISNTSASNSEVTPTSDLYMHDNNTSVQWNNTWDMQRSLPLETPESPLERFSSPPPPPPIIPVPPPMPDVDHRQLLTPSSLLSQVLLKGDDVDHRRLPPPSSNPPPQTQNDSNRNVKDVDHRNLISLTMGSIPPPPAPPPITPWTPRALQSDQDYRINEEFSTMVPPPIPILTMPPPIRRLMPDNVESIDMEMSDEENIDDPNQSFHDDEYTRNMRLENSMARIHGHSPGVYQHQPPMYRKQESNNRTPNNRMPSQNDSQNNSYPRTNLVRINSNDDLDDSSNYNYFNNKDKDIFSDFPSNAMNPQNPNVQQDNNSSYYSQSGEDWENVEEEEPWQKRGGGMMNPPMPNFGRTNSGPMFSQRPPQINFCRKPAPLLMTPLMDERSFKPHHSRGNGNYRRPRGHHRPPRGNRQMSNHW